LRKLKLNVFFVASIIFFTGCSRWERITLKPLDINVTEPSLISILFQAKTDNESSLENHIQSNRFLIYEDGELLKDDNIFKSIEKGSSKLNFQRDIILAFHLTNSFNRVQREISIEALKNSFEKGIIQIDNRTRVMIVSISDKIDLVLDFTSNLKEIESGLNRLLDFEVGSRNSGNLYENLARFGTLLRTDSKTLHQKSLLLITESGDTSSTLSVNELLKFINRERIYIAGIGENINREDLERIGEATSIFIDGFSEIDKAIDSILENIEREFESIYLIKYLSPKRASSNGEDEHLLTLRIFENGNSGEDSKLEAKFNSKNFKNAVPKIELSINGKIKNGERAIFRANTKWVHKKPQYEWFVLDTSLATISISKDNSEAILEFSRDRLGKSELLVKDISNGVELYYPLLLGIYKNIVFDFEESEIPPDFIVHGSGWEVTQNQRGKVVKSKPLANGEESGIKLKGYFDADKISFDYRISSEEGCDEMIFFMDGKGFYQSGLVDWSRVEYQITRGEHTFEWVYRKDSSMSKYEDAIWLDNISFTENK
jgi:hypothetical protein